MTNQRLRSERVVVQAPLSYTGSARRIWRMTWDKPSAVRWALLIPIALVLVALAWVVVTLWYVAFGLLMAPYRLVRRGSRKRRLADTRHREALGV